MSPSSPKNGTPPVPEAAAEDDDYMTMTFDDPPATRPETSLQRRRRQEREGRERGHTKSKAELAAEATAKREAGLATSLLASPTSNPTNPSKPKPASKGLAMMAKMGFAGGALGAPDNPAAAANAEPLRLEVKADRGGVGADGEARKRARAAEAEAAGRVKRAREGEGEFRERVRWEREEARAERLVAAAQSVAERRDGESRGEEGGVAAEGRLRRPLRSVNVLWRGVVRAREEAERDRRMRRDLEDSLSRLPTYEGDEDEDDKTALGRGKVAYAVAEDLDEEDEELDGFTKLEAGERLRQLVEFLRKEYHYCFWCKFTYPDDEMEGCPGLTEEDHD